MPKDALAFDRSASVRSYDSDGHLHVESANISKATVNPYFGKEIPGGGKDLEPEKVYKLLRDPKELLKAAPTFAGKPILIQHTPISADDHPHDQVIGSVGTDVKFDSLFLTAPLTIWDGDAIALIESGKQRALSCGYRYSVDWSPGSFNGESYDGVMRNIEANHLALVVEGRAGTDVIIGDENTMFTSMLFDRIEAALLAFDAEFKESDHQRSTSGQFSSTGKATLSTGHVVRKSPLRREEGNNSYTVKHPDTTEFHYIEHDPSGKVVSHSIDTPGSEMTVKGLKESDKKKTLDPTASQKKYKKMHEEIHNTEKNSKGV